ncbi:YjeF family domain-containing protein [Polytolypa hystricis UAMH7299]|uniref:ATP-dependent (S)-NAD(P)H-hydrate dehydratase n=1 Tax=Polytolypa hystricis (strain UAMH7299) TaxID=1447883 RepID=A0A2B7YBQ2_POLH7|nr:YjeF family domain-containing protein [Polytolypa hystricis UAMH7299]
MASARLGCDMSHVICEPSAATVIKSYSPNLMVHPILASKKSLSSSPTPSSPPSPSALAEPILSFLPRLHVLIIGPGLGRDPTTHAIVSEVIKAARTRHMPLVLDADAILLVQNNPDLVRGYADCILTPNVVEFSRLAKALDVDISIQENLLSSTSSEEELRDRRDSLACERLCSALGGVTIIQKGAHDVISNGITSVISDVRGGVKRSGGQGDTLTGSLGTFLAWRKAYHEGLWEDGEEEQEEQTAGEDRPSKETVEYELHDDDPDALKEKKKLSPATTLLLVAWAGSAITRECSRRAFVAKGRSMQASDLTDEVHESFLALIGEPEEGSKL